jgi:hypothetical protein
MKTADIRWSRNSPKNPIAIPNRVTVDFPVTRQVLDHNTPTTVPLEGVLLLLATQGAEPASLADTEAAAVGLDKAAEVL